MSEQEQQQEGQKTVVAFVAGLLIGGLLVWVFSGDANNSPLDNEANDDQEMVDESDHDHDHDTDTEMSDDEEDTTPANNNNDVEGEQGMVVSEGSLDVADQPAGSVVTITSATFPTDDGWIAVRSFNNGQLGNILGAARYSKFQGLIPERVELLAPTRAGAEYAVVFFTENGDHDFDLATDSQIDVGTDTFTAK